MSVYRRGSVWWYKFYFAGRLIRESDKTRSKTLAKDAEKLRRRELETGYNGITDDGRSSRVKPLREAADDYATDYESRHPRSFQRYARYCIQHLVRLLGDTILIDVNDQTVGHYQRARLHEGASGKTINEEVATLLRIMGGSGDLLRIKLKTAGKLRLAESEDCGKALTLDEERRLLVEARKSKSSAIFPAIALGLNTGTRDSEMRQLTWAQLDFFKQILVVGKSKTKEGTGRTIPINTELLRVLAEYKTWYETNVGAVTPQRYVFPWSRGRHYDPTRPMVTFKTAWTNVRERSDVYIRLHDLRHTLITKLAESGAGDETIMAIAGHVSRRMLSRYAHIRTEAKRRALEAVATRPVRIPEPEKPVPPIRIQ